MMSRAYGNYLNQLVKFIGCMPVDAMTIISMGNDGRIAAQVLDGGYLPPGQPKGQDESGGRQKDGGDKRLLKCLIRCFGGSKRIRGSDDTAELARLVYRDGYIHAVFRKGITVTDGGAIFVVQSLLDLLTLKMIVELVRRFGGIRKYRAVHTQDCNAKSRVVTELLQ